MEEAYKDGKSFWLIKKEYDPIRKTETIEKIIYRFPDNTLYRVQEIHFKYTKDKKLIFDKQTELVLLLHSLKKIRPYVFGRKDGKIPLETFYRLQELIENNISEYKTQKIQRRKETIIKTNINKNANLKNLGMRKKAR